MKREDLREFSAIPMVLFVLGILALIMLAFTRGLWAWLGLGLLFVVALAAVALVGMARPHHPNASSANSRSPRVEPEEDDHVYRVLVVADEACGPSDLAPALTHHGGNGRTQVLVVAPALGSRTARWTGDGRPYDDAAKHLVETIRALGELNIDAGGHIGSHDPLQAADDGLREFAADEIVFAVHPEEDANWLEHGVVASARTRYPIPVTELTIERR